MKMVNAILGFAVGIAQPGAGGRAGGRLEELVDAIANRCVGGLIDAIANRCA